MTPEVRGRLGGVSWSAGDVDSRDRNGASTAAIVQASTRLRAGQVMLMHEWPSNTIAAVLLAPVGTPATGAELVPDRDDDGKLHGHGGEHMPLERACRGQPGADHHARLVTAQGLARIETDDVVGVADGVAPAVVIGGRDPHTGLPQERGQGAVTRGDLQAVAAPDEFGQAAYKWTYACSSRVTTR